MIADIYRSIINIRGGIACYNLQNEVPNFICNHKIGHKLIKRKIILIMYFGFVRMQLYVVLKNVTVSSKRIKENEI